MYISQVTLKGFRNFKDATINFTEKSLVIGSNEVGKTNLLYALRLLLDSTVPETNLEPEDSDFYVHEEINEIEIIVEFSDVCEDCVLSKLREKISDDGKLYLAYWASRDPLSRRKTYGLLAGHSTSDLDTIESRFYLRVLNVKYMGSNRDLFAYIRRERKNLLQDAREARSESEIEQDSKLLQAIADSLENVEDDIRQLSYVGKATESLNSELSLLSVQNVDQEVIFDTGASDVSQFIDNLRLASQVGTKPLAIGGDGRNNQIQLALWAGKNNIVDEDEPLEVCIFCIEEPEAHLHPHQQRKLAEYLYQTLSTQVIITSHSPQIACEFPPDSIIRLYNNKPDTLAAGNGASPFIETSFIDFGYRLSIIPAETFFACAVLLVEGPSEELFYKALARQIGIDLDALNISILMVDGVGFAPYVSLLTSLRIDFVIRTDNDIFKIKGKDEYRFAGVQRAINIYRRYFESDIELDRLLEDEHLLSGFPERTPPPENQDYAEEVATKLEEFGIYLSMWDLERDLHKALGDTVEEYFGFTDDEELLEKMQKRKATFMFEFMNEKMDVLSDLADDKIALPLYRCKEIAECLA